MCEGFFFLDIVPTTVCTLKLLQQVISEFLEGFHNAE